MKQKLPINTEILRWARTSLGLSLEEIGAKFKKSATEIEAWESGESSPTYPQLERLAHEIYKRPVAVFFFPAIPDEGSPKTDFRALPEEFLEELPSGMIKLYRKAKLYQLYLEELFEGEKPVDEPLIDLIRLNSEPPSTTILNQIRNRLGISIPEQSTWHSTDTAFKKWREAFEAAGIYVFKDAFRNDGYSGFCLHDPKYPIIFVNNSMPDSRQVFTLFHELGHLLQQAGGIDFRTNEITRSFRGYYQEVEVACNRFANQFLVPEESLDQFELQVNETTVDHLAKYFSVSREVILRNYRDRGLVNDALYEEWVSKWNNQAKNRKGDSDGGNYYYTQHAYLGDNYINLVYGKYYQNKISRDNVAEYLNVKAKNLNTLEYVVMEGGRL
ncbi:MAG: ImmA/IrrE family metallo-endopeptidase [Candidatus Marinimicrobia bacterium]|nr:ImmA/IrrE family metallo-endopeptidase [Candidatus Neomarinimicrobiota bacterium]